MESAVLQTSHTWNSCIWPTLHHTLQHIRFILCIFHLTERVQEELSRVVGCHQVQMQDKKKLPYTDAVIHEIQRMADIVPTVRHCTSRDVSFQGYIIKKVIKTEVVYRLCSHRAWSVKDLFHSRALIYLWIKHDFVSWACCAVSLYFQPS